MTRMAFEYMPILLKLVPIKGNQLGRGVVGFIFQSNDFQLEPEARDIHIGTFVLAAGIFLLQTRSGIHSQSNIGDVGSFAHMNAPDRRVDIDLLIFSVLRFLHVDAASWQQQSCERRRYTDRERTSDLKFVSAHVQSLRLRPAPEVRDRRRAGLHLESGPADDRESESPQRAL